MDQKYDFYRVASLSHRFQLERFASASAWVLWHLFDREADTFLYVSQSSPLPSPNERLGRFLLDEILKAGNFVHYDKRLKANRYASRIGLMVEWLHHTMRLVRFFPMEVDGHHWVSHTYHCGGGRRDWQMARNRMK